MNLLNRFAAIGADTQRSKFTLAGICFVGAFALPLVAMQAYTAQIVVAARWLNLVQSVHTADKVATDKALLEVLAYVPAEQRDAASRKAAGVDAATLATQAKRNSAAATVAVQNVEADSRNRREQALRELAYFSAVPGVFGMFLAWLAGCFVTEGRRLRRADSSAHKMEIPANG